jgi:hypothetical protein
VVKDCVGREFGEPFTKTLPQTTWESHSKGNGCQMYAKLNLRASGRMLELMP